MILSLSRRTDIPAYYSTWLLNRLEAGFALTQNPFNHNQIRRLSLAPEAVTALVIWTKNPAPLIPHLARLQEYTYYFQFTLNPYDQTLEPRLPPKPLLTDAFKSLADQLGPQRVVWRYDPIILNPDYNQDYHRREFSRLAAVLAGRTERCVVSFLEPYPKIKKFLHQMKIHLPSRTLKRALLQDLAALAAAQGIELETCANDLEIPGLRPAACVDANLLERLLGFKAPLAKDKHQRPLCRCAASVDLGAYDSCPAGCLYCYANRGSRLAAVNHRNHRPEQAFIIGPYQTVEKRAGRPERNLTMF